MSENQSFILVVSLLFASIPRSVFVNGDAEVMSHVTVHFGKLLEECREESGLTKEAMEVFHHYWNDDFETLTRELGCAIICMSNKLTLLQTDINIDAKNMEEYIKSFPNGEILADKMVGLLQMCEKKYENIVDDCTRVAHISTCFKHESNKEGIAPEIAMLESVLEKY